MLKTKQTEKLEQKTKVVIFPLKFVCIFMNILILSIFKPKAKQKFKATVPSFKQHFSKCPNQRNIFPPFFVHRMFSSLSNKLILYLLHYQTPCSINESKSVLTEWKTMPYTYFSPRRVIVGF